MFQKPFSLKTEEEIKKMSIPGKIVANCHKEISKMVKPGITTWEIDQFVERYIEKHGASSAQKGYMGYPYATCVSINDEVCHGFPRKEKLKTGDIVTIDMVISVDGWMSDSAWTYAVGKISDENKRLMKVTKESLYKGIEKAVLGNTIGDISFEIQSFAEENGYSVVRDFIGHGIGKVIHEPPEVPHFGGKGTGPLLQEGMVITIEPMLNVGEYHIKVQPDGWTAKTRDGSISCQYEHTLAITKDGPIILTEQN